MDLITSLRHSGHGPSVLASSRNYIKIQHFLEFAWSSGRSIFGGTVTWIEDEQLMRLVKWTDYHASVETKLSEKCFLNFPRLIVFTPNFSSALLWETSNSKVKQINWRFFVNVTIDRSLMFYAQATAKGHIRAKQSGILPQVKFWFIIQYAFDRWRLTFFRENEVEYDGKAETKLFRSPVSRHTMQRHIPTFYRRRQGEPVIALGSHQRGT